MLKDETESISDDNVRPSKSNDAVSNNEEKEAPAPELHSSKIIEPENIIKHPLQNR